MVTEVQATISKLGSMPERRGNLHVGVWLVDSDDYESILEPVTDYRCPDPASADVDDPAASGCRQVGEGAGYNWSMLTDMTLGSKLVVRIAEGDVTRFRYAEAPTLTVNETSTSLRVRGACTITGAHTWNDIGRLWFGSAKVRVHSCDMRQDAFYVS